MSWRRLTLPASPRSEIPTPTARSVHLIWQTKHAMATRSCAGATCTFYKCVESSTLSSLQSSVFGLPATATPSLPSLAAIYVAYLTLVCKNARLLLTFSILWTRMRPLFGLPSFSDDMISSSFSSLMPSARSVNRSSTSILAYKEDDKPKCELHS